MALLEQCVDFLLAVSHLKSSRIDQVLHNHCVANGDGKGDEDDDKVHNVEPRASAEEKLRREGIDSEGDFKYKVAREAQVQKADGPGGGD